MSQVRHDSSMTVSNAQNSGRSISGGDNTGNQYLHKTVYIQFSPLDEAFIKPHENGRRPAMEIDTRT